MTTELDKFDHEAKMLWEALGQMDPDDDVRTAALAYYLRITEPYRIRGESLPRIVSAKELERVLVPCVCRICKRTMFTFYNHSHEPVMCAQCEARLS